MKKILSFIIGITFMSSLAFGAGAQLSVPGTNLPNSQSVTGVRLAVLYGETKNVSGLNVTLLGISDVDNFSGLELGILGVNKVQYEFKGLAFGVVNWHEGQDTGINFGLVNYVHDVKGINFGFANFVNGDSTANVGAINLIKGDSSFNLGLANISQGSSLVDLGIINYAESTTFQLGLINATKHLDGLQVGLVNYAENGVCPVLPLINFKKSL